MDDPSKDQDKTDLQAAVEILDAVYGAVLDQDRFDELIELSTRELHDPSEQNRLMALKHLMDDHLQRAETMLAQLPGEWQSSEQSRPSVTLSTTGQVQQVNPAARLLFELKEGETLDGLKLGAHELRLLRSFLNQETHTAPVLQLVRKDTLKPCLMTARRSQINGSGTVILEGAEALWDERCSAAAHALYGLTASEAEVLGLLLAGLSPLEVADARARALNTVRQQIRSMISKTNAQGMQGLLRIGQALAQSAAARSTSVSTSEQSSETTEGRHHHVLPDGRIIDWTWQGDANGEAMVFLHGCLCGNRFPAGAVEYLKQQGLRVIAPARPNHGQSSDRPDFVTDTSRYAEDIAHLLDALGVKQCQLLAFDVGAIVALKIAEKLQHRVSRILCVSAQPPMRSWRDFATAPPQQRTFALLPRISLPLLSFLAKAGDRRLKRDGVAEFPKTVFAGSEADLRACEDPVLLNLFWEGHLFHVENGSDGFINDCRLVAAPWDDGLSDVPVPLHFVHGDKNVSVPPERILGFADRLRAQVTLLPDAGHSAVFSHWPQIFDLVQSFNR